MANEFNDRILWPAQLDNFPNLHDLSGTQILPKNIVYAEHFRKVANFVHTAEPLLTPSAYASGNLTVFGLGYTFKLWAKLGDIYRVFAKTAADNPTINQPGNILPFEFIVTSSPDVFTMRQNELAGNRIIYQVPTTSELLKTVGAGQDIFTILPLVSVSIIGVPYPSDPFVDTKAAPVTGMIVNHYLCANSNTLMIRGCVINTGLTNTINQTNSESWMNSAYNFMLNVTIVSLKR